MIPNVGRRAFWLLALALLGFLQTAWLTSAVPLPLRIWVAALLAVSIFRPAWGLLLWAGLAPLSTSLAGFAGPPELGPQLLEAMTTAVITGAVARHTPGPATRLALPTLLMGLIALASGLAELPGRLISTTHDAVTFGTVARLLVQHAVDRIPPLEPWYFAMVISAGAALAWTAESLVRRDAELAPRVIWCALMSHAGVGIINLTRVIGASLRSGEFPESLPGLFLTIRSHSQYDVNAAASILVMVILASVGLTSRRARLPLLVAVSVATISLWVAGSRVALASLALTLAAVLALRTRHSVRTWLAAGAAVVVSIGVIAWLALGYPANRNLDLPRTFASRAILFNTALAMAKHAPIVGVGAGTFLEESPTYGAWAIAPYVHDSRTRDNAHNYFLQTLAEQGVLGLLALLAVLAAALVPALRTTPRRDVLNRWLTGGILASMLTWMTGHPLLVTEAALMFWMFVGVLAAMSEPRPVSPPGIRMAALAIVAIAASVPFRAAIGEREANLEHLAAGVSQWNTAPDGERYRVAGTEFSLWLPSGTTMVLPLQSATGSAVRLELRVASRPIDALVAEPGAWRQFRIQVPESPSRFVEVDFRLLDASPCQECIKVGKATLLPGR